MDVVDKTSEVKLFDELITEKEIDEFFKIADCLPECFSSYKEILLGGKEKPVGKVDKTDKLYLKANILMGLIQYKTYKRLNKILNLLTALLVVVTLLNAVLIAKQLNLF